MKMDLLPCNSNCEGPRDLSLRYIPLLHAQKSQTIKSNIVVLWWYCALFAIHIAAFDSSCWSEWFWMQAIFYFIYFPFFQFFRILLELIDVLMHKECLYQNEFVGLDLDGVRIAHWKPKGAHVPVLVYTVRGQQRLASWVKAVFHKTCPTIPLVHLRLDQINGILFWSCLINHAG